MPNAVLLAPSLAVPQFFVVVGEICLSIGSSNDSLESLCAPSATAFLSEAIGMAVNKNKMCFIPQPVSPLFLCVLLFFVVVFFFQIPDGKVSLTNVFPRIDAFASCHTEL